MKCRIAMLLLLLMVWAGEAVAKGVPVVYRLKWLANMSTVGDYYALSQGYFQAQSLDVTIKPGGPERDAIRELELGHAQFGVASADQVIRALARGAPVVVVAQLFQVNPLRWIYRADQLTINGPTDLKGLRLGVTFGKNDEIIMRTMLARANIDVRQVDFYSVRLDYAPFFNGDVDLWPVYLNTQGIEIRERMRASGEQIRFMDPNRYGVRFVANSVVTSKKMIKHKPELVRRFVGALLKGWHQAMHPANSTQAVAVVRSYDRDTADPVLERQLQATRELVQPSPRQVIGKIDRSAWEQTEDMMLQHRQIDQPVRVAEHLSFEMIP
jgi:NitT/TauT family transport system substrate-binding protein